MVAAPQKKVSRAGFGCAAGAAAGASPGAFAAAQAGDAPPEDFPSGGSLSKQTPRGVKAAGRRTGGHRLAGKLI